MDPRAGRTRDSLRAALLALAAERPVEALTIGEITRAADVNRSTFYQHYADKESLLVDALEHAIVPVAGVPEPVEGMPETLPPELLDYLTHIADHLSLYRSVFGPNGAAAVRERLAVHIADLAREAIARRHDLPHALPVDVAAAAVTGSAVAVIAHWVSCDPLPEPSVAFEWLALTLLPPGLGARRTDEGREGMPVAPPT